MKTPDDILNARILMVDDQPYNIALLRMILKEAGYTHMESTTDPREAQPMYLANKPDIVLLDLQMPHIDGLA